MNNNSTIRWRLVIQQVIPLAALPIVVYSVFSYIGRVYPSTSGAARQIMSLIALIVAAIWGPLFYWWARHCYERGRQSGMVKSITVEGGQIATFVRPGTPWSYFVGWYAFWKRVESSPALAADDPQAPGEIQKDEQAEKNNHIAGDRSNHV